MAILRLPQGQRESVRHNQESPLHISKSMALLPSAGSLTQKRIGALSAKKMAAHSNRRNTYRSCVANGQRLPSCPDASCSLSRPMAKRSTLMADSLAADVRPGLVASLRISERCCSSSSLVRHSMWVSPVFHFNEYFDSPRFGIARRCVSL